MLIDTKELSARLAEVKTIAVVGASDKPGRPVDMVGRRLIEWGYEVIPVHPKRQEVWGLTAYPSVVDIPKPVDVVDLFRNPEFCPDHARETLAMVTPPSIFWMQQGIRSDEARDILDNSGILVVEDACIKVELLRLGIRP